LSPRNRHLLATKLRALLQRDKGRDLLDLAYALDKLEGLNISRLIQCLSRYLAHSGTPISRVQAEQRMFAKLAAPRFLADIRPLLAPEEAARLTDDVILRAFAAVFDRLIAAMPGEPWAKTAEKRHRFGL
jgi:hypothetical protein